MPQRRPQDCLGRSSQVLGVTVRHAVLLPHLHASACLAALTAAASAWAACKRSSGGGCRVDEDAPEWQQLCSDADARGQELRASLKPILQQLHSVRTAREACCSWTHGLAIHLLPQLAAVPLDMLAGCRA